MAMKTTGRKTYTTARGKSIDLDLLMKRNELTPAVGNARVNARGDELGPGGKIIRKREDVVKDYYKGSAPVANEDRTQKTVPNKAQDAAPKKVKEDAPVLSEKDQALLEEFDDGWEEDDEGNFVKKQ
jgi:hypothetical protein